MLKDEREQFLRAQREARNAIAAAISPPPGEKSKKKVPLDPTLPLPDAYGGVVARDDFRAILGTSTDVVPFHLVAQSQVTGARRRSAGEADQKLNVRLKNAARERVDALNVKLAPSEQRKFELARAREAKRHEQQRRENEAAFRDERAAEKLDKPEGVSMSAKDPTSEKGGVKLLMRAEELAEAPAEADASAEEKTDKKEKKGAEEKTDKKDKKKEGAAKAKAK